MMKADADTYKSCKINKITLLQKVEISKLVFFVNLLARMKGGRQNCGDEDGDKSCGDMGTWWE